MSGKRQSLVPHSSIRPSQLWCRGAWEETPQNACLPLLAHDVLEHFADKLLGQDFPVAVGEDGIYMASHPVQRGPRPGWGQAREQCELQCISIRSPSIVLCSPHSQRDSEPCCAASGTQCPSLPEMSSVHWEETATGSSVPWQGGSQGYRNSCCLPEGQ